MARPYWSGHVQISLMSFGVRFFTATESKSQISFHEIDRRTGERIRHRKVAGDDEDKVDRSDIVKGYEYSKGEYVILEPDELKKLRIASNQTFNISQFVDVRDLDFAYFEKPYFVLPEDDAHANTYNVMRKAMVETGKAGLGEVSFSGREHLVALMPADGKDSSGMMAYILRYADELRDAKPLFEEIKASKIDTDQLTLAKELIKRSSAKFDPKKFQDDYEAAVRELVEAKMKHLPLPKEEPPRRGKVINLTDALRRSLSKQEPASVEAGGKTAARSAEAVSGRQARGKVPTSVASAARRRKTA